MLSKLKEWKKALVAFAASYFLLFILQAVLGSSGTIAPWENNPAFYIIPVIGFFFMYLIIDWIGDYFETGFAKKAWFPALFLITALLAWHVALVFYSQNNVILGLKQNQYYQNGQEVRLSDSCIIKALSDGGKRNETIDSFAMANCTVSSEFVSQLKNSTFLVFILSGLFGWLSKRFISGK